MLHSKQSASKEPQTNKGLGQKKNKPRPREMVSLCLDIISSQSLKKEIINQAIAQIFKYPSVFVRKILLHDWSRKVSFSTGPSVNSEVLSPNVIHIRNAIIAVVEVRNFSFQQGIITKAQLQSLLRLFPAFISFPEKLKTQKYPFIETLKEFCDKLRTDELDANDILCLQRIIDDYDSPEFSFYAPEPEDAYRLLTEKLEQTESLKEGRQQDTPPIQKRLTFSQCMERYVFKECLPYFSVMSRDVINQLLFSRDTKNLQEFIKKRHLNTPCLPDSVYAPGGTITELGVKNFFAQVYDWSSILKEWMPNHQPEITAGIISCNRTISQDEKYWPDIVRGLFIQMIRSRALLYDAIVQERVSFHGGAPQNINELIEMLSALDRGDNIPFEVDRRVTVGFDTGLFNFREMSLSYHIIFDAMVFVVKRLLILRTQKAIDHELSVYPDEDIRIVGKLKELYDKIDTLSHATLCDFIKNTRLRYILKHVPVADFMKFIEVTHERKIELTTSIPSEPDLFEQTHTSKIQSVPAIHPFLFVPISSTLQQTVHYERVNYYLTADLAFASQPENIQWCIETFQKILQDSFATEKELLLLILAWDKKHELNTALEQAIELSFPGAPLDSVTQKIAEKLDSLCHFKVIQRVNFHSGHVNLLGEYMKNEPTIRKIFHCIHESSVLFESYCRHLLNKNYVDNLQLNFLVKYFKDVKETIQEPELITKLSQLCRPVWDAHVTALQNKLTPSGCFFQAYLPNQHQTVAEIEIESELANDFDYIKTQCVRILSQDTVSCSPGSWLPTLFTDTKRTSSRGGRLVDRVSEATSIEGIYDELTSFQETTKKNKAALGQCLLLIAKKTPELVQFESVLKNLA